MTVSCKLPRVVLGFLIAFVDHIIQRCNQVHVYTATVRNCETVRSLLPCKSARKWEKHPHTGSMRPTSACLHTTRMPDRPYVLTLWRFTALPAAELVCASMHGYTRRHLRRRLLWFEMPVKLEGPLARHPRSTRDMLVSQHLGYRNLAASQRGCERAACVFATSGHG